jgi:tetratricopeptide (TPR) repeat protein
LAIALAVVICFAPAFQAGFLTWDDAENFTLNTAYRGLSWEHLRWMFTTFHLGHYQPLSWLTLGLDFTLWGMDARGYHVTNVLLHGANAVLFYLLALKLLRLALGTSTAPAAATPALFLTAATAALLFAVHPLRVESVAWVSERRDVLSGFWYLATLLTYLQMHTAPAGRHRWFATSVGCLMLSLLSKAWGMTMPLVLLALDFYPLHRLEEGKQLGVILLEKLPYCVLAGLAAALALMAQSHGAEMSEMTQHGLAARVGQAAYGLCFYLAKTLVPIRLSPVYLLDPRLDPTRSIFVACLITVLLITTFAVAVHRRWPWVLTSWIIYMVILAPVLGFAQTGPQLVADRYTYLSCLPWALLSAAGLAHIGRGRERLMALASVGVIGLLAVLTIRHTGVWQDSMTLWNHALRLDPRNAVALFSRGVTYESTGDLDRALVDYTAAIAIEASYADPYFGRGNVHRARGNRDAALADYGMVVRLRPDDPRAYVNRGLIYQSEGDLERASSDFTEAIRRDESCADAYLLRGDVRRARGALEQAAADYRRALDLAPADWSFRERVRNNLAEIQQQRSRP